LLPLWQYGLTCCVTSNFVRIGDKTFAPKAKDSIIDVFVSDEEPVEVLQALPDGKPIATLPKGSTKIARVDTNGAPAAEWIAVINDAKIKARMVGGDAIVISRWGSPVVCRVVWTADVWQADIFCCGSISQMIKAIAAFHG